MINRKLSSPILKALVLALAASSPLVGQTQTQVPNAPSTAPAMAPASTTAAVSGSTPAVSAAKHTAPYTVVKGDSLSSIARKFNTTRKKLRDLNSLPASVATVKPGDILQVPAAPVSKAAAARAKAKAYAMAQPVQDFDVPASTFASCPPTPGDDAAAAEAQADPTDDSGKPAPIAKLVSPAEMAADPGPEVEIITPTTPRPGTIPTPTATMTLKPLPPLASAPASSTVAANVTAPAASTTVSKNASTFGSRPGTAFSTGASTASVRPVPAPVNSSTARFGNHAFSANPAANLSSTSGAAQAPSNGDWGTRFFQQARALGNQGIEYDDDWRPPGEAHSWVMDCSNTSRYLYKVTAGIQLPRTASDQYYYLHLQGKAWDAPMNSQGFVDTEYLRRNLKPGDLLFWENTYRPERQPPITHVMVYLGSNDKGQWIMAGSQSSRGGEHNRRNGGPDIYVFRPSQPCGGYTTWMGMVHHQGRFCAFGRPLEADPTKLSVAANE